MNIFQQITDYVKREYSTFDMKNNWVGSINGFGSLNAIYSSIVLPSDTWKLGHNVLVKLPPLISPAFTRIKGIVNSYYCSFASVWNYWNSFISDKPEDAFLSRSLTSSYKGKFVEPCVSFAVIAYICKVARGYFDYSNSSVHWNGNIISVVMDTMYFDSVPVGGTEISSPTTIVWSYDSNGRRKANLTDHISSSQFEHDTTTPVTFTFHDYGTTSIETAEKLGFNDERSYFIWCCQQVERNLSNHGFPTDLIAKTKYTYYYNKFCNLLPFLCESSIWHNFYRDEQNQSPEFDYREVNGVIHNSTGYPATAVSSMPYGWKLRLLGIPPNTSNGSDYWFPVTSFEDVFSVLTGYYLEETVRNYLESSQSGGSVYDLNILPKFYNGLLTLKYRNFEKDYFTSASVDPNYGGVSVLVPNTIDSLRTASKLEEFLEVSASARDFYNFMKHIFGTNPESTRYTKPLLLGTQVIPVQIGEQLQTSQTTTGTSGSPLGERAGIADGFGNSGTVNHYFNEHGIVVSYLSFVLDSQYMQGMPHEFMHHLQLDYPFPQFANLGAESIPTTEIYFSNNSLPRDLSYLTGDNNAVSTIGGTPSYVTNRVDAEGTSNGAPSSNTVISQNGLGVRDSVNGLISYVSVDRNFYQSSSPTVFGYTPRYSKWKFKQDVVAGQMRDSLEFWHTFRKFSSQPFISSNFVSYMNAGYLSDLNRIFADTNDNSDKFVCDVFNNGSVRRCLPLVPQTTMD